MAQPIQTIESTLRTVRTLHGILLFTMFLYAVTAEKIQGARSQALNPAFLSGLAVASIAILGIAQFMRVKYVRSALDTLSSTPDDPSSLANWRKGAIVSDVLLESIVLCGFVVRFLGGTFVEALPFYAVGIGLMILWWPQRP
jgi:hypothetical protein